MDPKTFKQSNAGNETDRLKQALIGLGYLPHGCADDEPKLKSAINEFRAAYGWRPIDRARAGRSVRFELSRQVGALQTKLAILGCYAANETNEIYEPGIFDKPTQMAVEKFKHDCADRAKELIEKCPIKQKDGTSLVPNEDQWLRSYQKADYEERKQLLKKLGFPNVPLLDDCVDGHGNISEAARNFHRYAQVCLLAKPDGRGICEMEIQWLLRNTPPFTFDDVLQRELVAIEEGRKKIRQASGITASPWAHSLSRAHEARLMGLAFSGGGIRSATFNLGVLQALAKFGLLKRFDYLSSVSGGGYIGGWLHAWVFRQMEEKAEKRKEQSATREVSPQAAIAEVEELLAGVDSVGTRRSGGDAYEGTPGPTPNATGHEPRPVAWLRRYSNYLTPRLGLLGADTMAGVATWLRNVLLNQTMLLLVISSVLFLPWLIAWLMEGVNQGQPYGAPAISFLVGCIGVGIAVALATFATSEKMHRVPPSERSRGLGVARSTLWLLCVACVLIGFSLLRVNEWAGELRLGLAAFVAFAFPSLVFLPYLRSPKAKVSEEQRLKPPTKVRRNVMRAVGGLLGGALFGALLVWLAGALPQADNYTQANATQAGALFLTTIVSPPAVLGSLLLAVALYIGVAGRALNESAREWWSRIGGMAMRTGLLWLMLTGITLYSAYAVMRVYEWVVALGGLAWLATTIGGLLASRSATTGDANSNRWGELLVRLAPYVFVAGLVVLLSWGLHDALVWAARKSPNFSAPTSCQEKTAPKYSVSLTFTPNSTGPSTSAEGVLEQSRPPASCDLGRYAEEAYGALRWLSSSVEGVSPALVLIGLPLFALLLAIGLGRRVDINVFAFHMFYRNRLERCYLGASNPKRQEHPYTDFDPYDSPHLDKLMLAGTAYGQRPFPLINTAINLTQASNLAWQERKAGSFVFTPQHCGYQLPDIGAKGVGGYQDTSDYVSSIGGWMPLSGPITISGAAASPNSGYHTNPATAALMTVFNVRLGRWIQNPQDKDVWRKPGPPQAMSYLLKELFATANEKDDFVYVSDGGHFENLALYELVRRRCRYIVVCDAGCDPDYAFEDLGNAVRKCKVDLSIDIDIDTRCVKPDSTSGLSGCHCAVGVIHYERVDKTPAAAPGYLLYVKATVTGDEPADAAQYRTRHPRFPHETTGDQWYTESQFESYRTLGFHAMSAVLEDAINDENRERHRRDDEFDKIRDLLKQPAEEGLDREILFKRLAERWYPSSDTPFSSSEHERALQTLTSIMRQDDQLRFLDTQFYPEWPSMARHVSDGKKPLRTMFPLTHRELHAGFHFCNQLIQLMNKVYEERDLENEYADPENRGWINLFRHWSGSGMFRATWAMSVSNYGAQFQQFCGRYLGLDVGRVQLGRRMRLEEAEAAKVTLTSAERRQLKQLRAEYVKWKWEEIAVVPLEVKVKDAQSDYRLAGFQFQIGFALIEGSIRIVGDDQGIERSIRYFRIRDHLRKMGLGRRALEALWREDAELVVNPPSNIEAVIGEADRETLMRLWHSVLAAVPHDQLKVAHELITKVDKGQDRSHLSEAERLCKEALKAQSDNEEAWRCMARIKRHQQAWDVAIQILDEIIDRDPNSSFAYYNRAAMKACLPPRQTGKDKRKPHREIEEDLRKAFELNYQFKQAATRDRDFNELKDEKWFKDLTS